MPTITDFFGKASKDTEHSVSTTVTADRATGVAVLSCFDLSTYTEDTPIYFVTYTKTADPLTGEVTITDTISWKGLVNGGENTITNLTIAPGYVDTGNAEGQFVECIPTSYWVNSMMDGIFVGINPDGTFKSSAVNKVLSSPQGFMLNGKLQRTVSSNNLTVAVKTLAGLDPSVPDPVLIRIGDTIRSITSALSLTLNAGTNWFGVGASYFGGNEGDFFAYLTWNTNTSAVILGIAREPDMRVFGDRDATSTNYGHLAIAGTAPAATDEMEVIGRFNATLGVTASFNWSVPATSIVINRPIFETREFSYANTGGAGGTMYFRQVGYQKELYGSTGAIGTGTATVTFPTGFFSAIKRIGADATGGYVSTNVVVGHIETYGINSMGVFNIVVQGSAPSNPVNVHVKGT